MILTGVEGTVQAKAQRGTIPRALGDKQVPCGWTGGLEGELVGADPGKAMRCGSGLSERSRRRIWGIGEFVSRGVSWKR